MFQDIKPRIAEPDIGKIISYAAFDGSPESIAKISDEYRTSGALNFHGWVESGKIAGICGFEVHDGKVEIHLISVAEDKRRQGIGGAMISALQAMYGLPIEAETDDEAVGFYRKRGFETTEIMHPRRGKRHICVLRASTEKINIYDLPPLPQADELTTILAVSGNIRIERIISTGQISGWYDQIETEFVVLLEGNALVEFENRTAVMTKGDTLLIKPHERHRVNYTSGEPPCVWLCIFY